MSALSLLSPAFAFQAGMSIEKGKEYWWLLLLASMVFVLADSFICAKYKEQK